VFIFLQEYSTNFIQRGEEKYGGNKRPVAGLFQAGFGEKAGAVAATHASRRSNYTVALAISMIGFLRG